MKLMVRIAGMIAVIWEVLFSFNLALAQNIELVVQKGHLDYVSAVSFSPDTKYVITGSNDKTAKLWDATTGIEIRTFMGHSDDVTSVSFSPDGKYFVTGSEDNTAKLWDVTKSAEISSFRGHSD